MLKAWNMSLHILQDANQATYTTIDGGGKGRGGRKGEGREVVHVGTEGGRRGEDEGR